MKKLPPTVITLGFISFFTDVSSDMIYPLLPVFLSTVLGGGAVALGVVEGIAESTSALFKILSGFWADRTGRRKPFLLAGYGAAGLARPLIGLAWAWPVVAVIRFIDRAGKGVRVSPRDALIADAVAPTERGRAYGFHRAMDHAGAVTGPLLAAGLLALDGVTLRHVFLLAGLPALVVMAIVVWGIKEPSVVTPPVATVRSGGGGWSFLNRDFRLFILAMLIFTLGNSTDAFLLLRLSEAGIPVSWVALLWSLLHFVKMTTTYLGGRMSDRLGRRTMIICGWITYALVYLGFGLVESQTGLIVVFLSYGVFFGFTEPAEKAWVADLARPDQRGAAFGAYHGVVGLAAMPASIIFGLIWKTWGPEAAFFTGAALAAAAAVPLFMIRTTRTAG